MQFLPVLDNTLLHFSFSIIDMKKNMFIFVVRCQLFSQQFPLLANSSTQCHHITNTESHLSDYSSFSRTVTVFPSNRSVQYVCVL